MTPRAGRRVPRRRSRKLRSGGRTLQNVARQAEQPAAALGLDHLLGGEAEAVQVLDQAGPFARVGDSRGFQRIEIDHQCESASSDAD